MFNKQHNFIFYFSVRLLLVPHGHSFFSSPPQRPMTSDFDPRFYPLHFNPILILEKEPVFLISHSNKGTTGTIFITSLV